MIILPVHKGIINYLKKRQLLRKFEKQCRFFIHNPQHSSLNLEILEPKHLKFYSFRLDKKYRIIFIFRGPDIIEILDVNNHYN